MDRWQRVMEAQLVERFTVAELAALARFYGTPEGQSVARKLVAVTAAVTPILEADGINRPMIPFMRLHLGRPP
jgi:hypothetical protein